MPVLLQVQVRSVDIRRKRLLRMAQAVLTDIGESSSEVALTFIGDRRMRRLNRQFRGKDRTTDVLAFAMREARVPSAGVTSGLLGDVVISMPTAIRQAREGRRSLDQEIAALLIHGILHLCGYDHERSRTEARRMQRRERMVLRRLGRISGLVRQAAAG